MAAKGRGLCYNRPMSAPPTTVAIGDAVLDGWALAAALDGGTEAVRGCAPAFARALADRLDALADPARKVPALRRWSKRVPTTVDARMLAAAPPRARALLAPLASPEVRSESRSALSGVPSPRPGYRPPAGLAAGLAARAARTSQPPSDEDRGRGRRALAALLGDDAASALLACAGTERDAVERLAELAGGEECADPIVPFALAAAASHADPVGRFGQLLTSNDAGARELRELEAACRV